MPYSISDATALIKTLRTKSSATSAAAVPAFTFNAVQVMNQV